MTNKQAIEKTEAIIGESACVAIDIEAPKSQRYKIGKMMDGDLIVYGMGSTWESALLDVRALLQRGWGGESTYAPPAP